MAVKKRRKPLTASVRRGLSHIVPMVDMNIDNGPGGDFQHLNEDQVDDVRDALVWIGQYKAGMEVEDGKED